MKKILGIIVLALLAAGCGIPSPTPQQEALAYYGEYPHEYQEIIKEHCEEYMFDPYSAKYTNWRGPVRGWVNNGRAIYYGYRACVNLNGKNRMGGYVGAKQVFLVIQDGRVVFDSSDEDNSLNVREACNKL